MNYVVRKRKIDKEEAGQFGTLTYYSAVVDTTSGEIVAKIGSQINLFPEQLAKLLNEAYEKGQASNG